MSPQDPDRWCASRYPLSPWPPHERARSEELLHRSSPDAQGQKSNKPPHVGFYGLLRIFTDFYGFLRTSRIQPKVWRVSSRMLQMSFPTQKQHVITWCRCMHRECCKHATNMQCFFWLCKYSRRKPPNVSNQTLATRVLLTGGMCGCQVCCCVCGVQNVFAMDTLMCSGEGGPRTKKQPCILSRCMFSPCTVPTLPQLACHELKVVTQRATQSHQTQPLQKSAGHAAGSESCCDVRK